MNSNGPRIAPCGTQKLHTFTRSELHPSSKTLRLQLVRKLPIQARMCPLIQTESNLSRKHWWETLSKTLENPATHRHTYIHAYTRVLHCNPASVGLAQARPNKASLPSLLLPLCSLRAVVAVIVCALVR